MGKEIITKGDTLFSNVTTSHWLCFPFFFPLTKKWRGDGKKA